MLKWTTVNQFFAILLMAEIPNNHLGCIKPLFIVGQTTNLNWLAGFQPSTVVFVPIFISPQVRCDLVVGADGLKSRLRSQLLGDGAPRHHGREKNTCG